MDLAGAGVMKTGLFLVLAAAGSRGGRSVLRQPRAPEPSMAWVPQDRAGVERKRVGYRNPILKSEPAWWSMRRPIGTIRGP